MLDIRRSRHAAITAAVADDDTVVVVTDGVPAAESCVFIVAPQRNSTQDETSLTAQKNA